MPCLQTTASPGSLAQCPERLQSKHGEIIFLRLTELLPLPVPGKIHSKENENQGLCEMRRTRKFDNHNSSFSLQALCDFDGGKP